MTYLAAMPTLVRDVLDELCQARETRSAVTLAASLVDRGMLSQHGDPVGLVTSVVEELADAGLVRYTLRYQWSGIPLAIRVTKHGYSVAGYATVHPETGSRAADHVHVDRGPTDWRTLDSQTWGGPIERMTIEDHLRVYPDHRSIHSAYLETRNMGVSPARADQIVATITERGGRASAKDIQSALRLSNEPAYRAINEALAFGRIERVGPKGARGTYYVVKDAAGEAIDAASTRQAILRIVERDQPTDSQAIARALSRDFPAFASTGLHKAQHLIHQLIKQGELEGRVDRRGGVSVIVGVRLAKRREITPGVAVVDQRSEIIVDPVPAPETQPVADVQPEPVAIHAKPYPILEGLLLREAERQARQARADALLAAASALEGFDLEEADRLFAKAATIASEGELSALEAEYLAYAEEHR